MAHCLVVQSSKRNVKGFTLHGTDIQPSIKKSSQSRKNSRGIARKADLKLPPDSKPSKLVQGHVLLLADSKSSSQWE